MAACTVTFGAAALFAGCGITAVVMALIAPGRSLCEAAIGCVFFAASVAHACMWLLLVRALRA